MADFNYVIEKRRSIYNIGKNISLSHDDIVEMVKYAVKYTPTAFNSQSCCVVVIFDENNEKFWNIVENKIKNITTDEQFEKSKQKISSFKKGVGTILFFEDKNIIKSLEEKYPLYKNNMDIWANQSNGMLQYIIWCMLAEKNIGASLQHYNELIENDVNKEFDINSSWKIIAQMPFGSIEQAADNKDFIDIEKRVKVRY